jgi:BMFP domain-containing protein YqiC
MTTPRPDPVDELLTRVTRVLESTPAAELPRRLRIVLEQAVQQLDLATRSELEAYVQWAAGARQRIDQLEARIVQLEARTREAAP